MHGWRDCRVNARHPNGITQAAFMAAFRYARTAAYAERSRFLSQEPQAQDARIIRMMIKNIHHIFEQGGGNIGAIQKKGHIKSGCHYDESQ